MPEGFGAARTGTVDELTEEAPETESLIEDEPFDPLEDTDPASSPLDTGGHNLLQWSSFETPAGWRAGPGWTVPGTVAIPFHGESVAHAVTTDDDVSGRLETEGLLAIDPTKPYWLSFWSWFVPLTDGAYGRLILGEYDATGALLRETIAVELTAIDTAWGRWARRFARERETVDDIGWTIDTVAVSLAFETSGAAALDWMVDAVQFEQGTILTQYAPRSLELINGDQIAPGTVPPTVFDTTPPSVPVDLSLTATALLQPDGTTLSSVTATLIPPPEEDYDHTELHLTQQYDGAGLPLWDDPTVMRGQMPAGMTRLTFSPVRAGEVATVRARSVDRVGNRSDFTPDATIVVLGDPFAPPIPTGLTAVAGFRFVGLRWDASSAADLAHYEARWRLTAGPGAWSSRSVRGTGLVIDGLTATEDPTTHAPTTSYDFQVRAVDLSGNVQTGATDPRAVPAATSPDAGWSATVTALPLLVNGSTDIGAGSIPITAFASTITPIAILGSLPALPDAAYPQGRVVFLTTDNQLYRSTGSAWVATVPTTGLTGTISTAQIADAALTTAKFAAGIRPVGVGTPLPTLPDALWPVGSTYSLTSDGKLYRNVAGAWVATTPAGDITGQIVGTQITDGSIITAKLAANAVTAAKIAANTITANEIAADTITAGQIAAGAISTSELAALAVTAAKIAAGTITANEIAALTITAGLIAAGAITTAKIAALAITSNELAANSVIAGKVAAAAISTNELAALAVTAAKIAANTITAAQIAAGTITATQIAANTITAANILAASITGDRLVADTITAAQIAADAITATELAANAVTAAKVAAGTITTTHFNVAAKAPQLLNADSSVEITPTGITIRNGAISLLDGSGATVMAAAGFGGAWNDYIETNLYNNDLTQRPPTLYPTAANNTTNKVPYWSVVTTGTHTFAYVEADATQPGGFRGRFEMTATGLNTDETAYEQDIPVYTSRVRTGGYVVSASVERVTATGTNFLSAIYLDAAKADIGTAAEATYSGVVGIVKLVALPSDGPIPTTARYLRVRVGYRRSPDVNAATGTMRWFDTQAMLVYSTGTYYPDENTASAFSPGRIRQTDGALVVKADILAVGPSPELRLDSLLGRIDLTVDPTSPDTGSIQLTAAYVRLPLNTSGSYSTVEGALTWDTTLNKVIIGTGSGTVTLLDTATGGTSYQPLNANLTAIAGLTSAADRLPYFTGAGTAAVATFTAPARTVLDDASVAAMVDTLGGAAATGSGGLVRATSPTLVTPALGTPSALVGTNISGTAAGLTAGNVTTNANLTGDVTSVGNATTIGAAKVTLAMMANLATDRLIGRDTAGTGVPEALTVGGGIEFTGSGGIQSSAYTGDVTKAAGGTATTLAAGNAGNLNSGTLLAARMPALTGDVTTSAGAVATTIAAGVVTLAKMANLATDTLIGRATAGTGVPEAIALTSFGRALIAGASQAAQRTSLGLGTMATEAAADYQLLTGKDAVSGYAGLDSAGYLSDSYRTAKGLSTTRFDAGGTAVWTKIASGSITATFQQSVGHALFEEHSLTAGNVMQWGRIRWRLSQGGTYPAAPGFVIEVVEGALSPDDVKAVITSTAGPVTYEVYVRLLHQWDVVVVKPLISNGSAAAQWPTWYSAQTLSTSLPAGTQVAATVTAASHGTAFPSNPWTNQRFFRTDRDVEYFYDGTRWLSVNLYTEAFLGVFGIPSTTLDVVDMAIPFPGLYDIWWDSADLVFAVAGGGTALSGSHFWTVNYVKQPANASILPSVFTINSGASAGTLRNAGVKAIGALNATTNFQLTVNVAKTGTPGDLTIMGRVNYRLVG
jgi:hypothetical protein